MIVKDLEKKIKQIRKDNPNLDIDNMEIGPLFDNGVIMMTNDIFIVEDGAWVENETNGRKVIAIEWHC
jgi:hypothetical protein